MESNAAGNSTTNRSPVFPMAAFIGGLGLGLLGGFCVFGLLFFKKETLQFNITRVPDNQYLFEILHESSSMVGGSKAPVTKMGPRLLVEGGQQAMFQVSQSRPLVDKFLPKNSENYQITAPVDFSTGTLEIKIW